MKPRILDLFCGAGGASVGYSQAGFDVVGVDLFPQPHYPFEFIQADALELDVGFLAEFDAIHASPPCQAFTLAQRIQQNDHPDLVDPTRQLLQQTERPYVIENVVGAPLREPVMLCGAMFPELKVYRHHLFETNFPLPQPAHPAHTVPITKMGRKPEPGSFMHVVGNFSGVDAGRDAMCMPWANRDGLREAIPPAFARYVGTHLRDYLAAERLAA